MATAVTGFRYVICPKCKSTLAEFANFPVYQCGGCGTTLRAKNYDATSKSPSSEHEMTACASKEGVQDAASPNPQSPHLDASNNCSKKGDELEHDESCMRERCTVSQSLKPADERNGMHIMTRNDPDYKLQDETGRCLNEVDKSSKLCEQGRESLKLSERIHDSGESTSLEAASTEDDTSNRGDHDGHGNMLRSTTTNSNPYDGSVSSGDDRRKGQAPHKRMGLSRRTFRQRKVQDSADPVEHKGEGVKQMTAGTQVQAQEASREPLNWESAAIDRVDSNANELSAKSKSHVRHHTSLGSEDFHSVQNWFEPETDEPLKSLSRDAEFLKGSAKAQSGSPPAGFNSLEHIQMEILKKVDELREEISELFDKPDEGKGGSHLRVIKEERPTNKHLDSDLVRFPPTAYWQRKDVPRQHTFADVPSGLPHITCMHCHHAANSCCRNGACHHGMSCKTCHHESRIEHELERPCDEEKRQQVKRHCRPVLGGAPFVICYNCFRLLQLPMDFFVAWKRLHELQCGACSKVLVFSFRAGNHRIPCVPNEIEHSTSEVDSSTDVTLRHESNAHSNDRSQSESIFYSEECGLSYSADVEPPTQMEKRNCKLRPGSQLHLLMGYGSASELLYRHSDIDEGFEITEPSTPHCNTPEETYLGDGIKEKASCISDDSTSEHIQNFAGTEEGEDESPEPEPEPEPERSRTRREGLLKIMKLKVHKNGRKNSDK